MKANKWWSFMSIIHLTSPCLNKVNNISEFLSADTITTPSFNSRCQWDDPHVGLTSVSIRVFSEKKEVEHNETVPLGAVRKLFSQSPKGWVKQVQSTVDARHSILRIYIFAHFMYILYNTPSLRHKSQAHFTVAGQMKTALRSYICRIKNANYKGTAAQDWYGIKVVSFYRWSYLVHNMFFQKLPRFCSIQQVKMTFSKSE